jgi:hypothetical protein
MFLRKRLFFPLVFSWTGLGNFFIFAPAYTWTIGVGCGYDALGERSPYSNRSEDSILYNASRNIYYIDEGEYLGVVDPSMIIGNTIPNVNNYSLDHPLQKVGVVQTLYPATLPRHIVERVKHCKRPGGPVEISEGDAEEILFKLKEAMEDTWTNGWDDEDAGEVQFVAIFDDVAVAGTSGRMLEEVTLDNSKLTAISIICIALFSAMFLCSTNAIDSRVLITLIGVGLVVLAFFAALGFALLVGTKLNSALTWTLPFIIVGLGVDDMYIVL